MPSAVGVPTKPWATALIVPSQAVQNGTLYTVRDGRLTKLDAKIGLRSIERAEVLSGAALGDKIVISPINDLAEDQRVRVAYMDPKVAADINKPKAKEVFSGFN